MENLPQSLSLLPALLGVCIAARTVVATPATPSKVRHWLIGFRICWTQLLAAVLLTCAVAKTFEHQQYTERLARLKLLAPGPPAPAAPPRRLPRLQVQNERSLVLIGIDGKPRPVRYSKSTRQMQYLDRTHTWCPLSEVPNIYHQP